MNPHTMFLRESCLLPEGMVLHKQRYIQDWMHVNDLTAIALDAKIRKAGWHFMWMMGSRIQRGYGWTSEGAVRQALGRALTKTDEQFNASELESIVVNKYPGFYVAKVILHPRKIQQLTSLEMPQA